jgi:GMP synthase (glutamine-hydrolysing)
MSRTALVLRHEPQVHLGNLAPVLADYGFQVRYVDTQIEDLNAINPATADLVIVLGGDMGVYEADEYPSITAELALLRQRFAARRPVFGICLGAQLMAGALGAEVYRGPTNEVGFRTVEPTDAGAESPLRHISGIPVMQWHGDTFDLPDGATRLAGSPAYGNEAFGIGNWALAVQFHPELTAAMHEEWLQLALRDEAESEPDSVIDASASALDPGALRAERERYSADMQEASQKLFSEWLDGLGLRKSL